MTARCSGYRRAQRKSSRCLGVRRKPPSGSVIWDLPSTRRAGSERMQSTAIAEKFASFQLHVFGGESLAGDGHRLGAEIEGACYWYLPLKRLEPFRWGLQILASLLLDGPLLLAQACPSTRTPCGRDSDSPIEALGQTTWRKGPRPDL